MIAVLAETPNRKKALLEIKRVLRDEGLLAIGEFLLDPDYPPRRTVTDWCKDAGFELVEGYGGVTHYLLTLKKSTVMPRKTEATNKRDRIVCIRCTSRFLPGGWARADTTRTP